MECFAKLKNCFFLIFHSKSAKSLKKGFFSPISVLIHSFFSSYYSFLFTFMHTTHEMAGSPCNKKSFDILLRLYYNCFNILIYAKIKLKDT